MDRRLRVIRHAVGTELERLRDPRRIAAIVILVVVFGVIGAGLLARGEEAGADARAYWGAVRIWLNGGDPYHPIGPFLPYVYAPWMLPLFAPWALLPWDVAWFVWRGGILVAWLATIHWAYERRPLATAIAVLVLSFPIAANLDTGNVTLILALGLWVAQFSGARLAGAIWAIATWMKVGSGSVLAAARPARPDLGPAVAGPGRCAEPADPAAHDHPAPGPLRLRAAAAPARLPRPAVGHRALAVAPPGRPGPLRSTDMAGDPGCAAGPHEQPRDNDGRTTRAGRDARFGSRSGRSLDSRTGPADQVRAAVERSGTRCRSVPAGTT